MHNLQIPARIPLPALRATFSPGEGMGAERALSVKNQRFLPALPKGEPRAPLYTVFRPFEDLLLDGLIQSRTGAKSSVVVTEEMLKRIRIELLEEEVRSAVTSFKLMGVTKEEAHILIEKYWKG